MITWSFFLFALGFATSVITYLVSWTQPGPESSVSRSGQWCSNADKTTYRRQVSITRRPNREIIPETSKKSGLRNKCINSFLANNRQLTNPRSRTRKMETLTEPEPKLDTTYRSRKSVFCTLRQRHNIFSKQSYLASSRDSWVGRWLAEWLTYLVLLASQQAGYPRVRLQCCWWALNKPPGWLADVSVKLTGLNLTSGQGFQK